MIITDLTEDIIRIILIKLDNKSIMNITNTSSLFKKFKFNNFIIPYFIFNKTFYHNYNYKFSSQISEYLFNYYSFRSYIYDLINAIDNLIYYNIIKDLNIVKKKERFYFYIDPFTIKNYYIDKNISSNYNVKYNIYKYDNIVDNNENDLKIFYLHNVYRVTYNIYFKYVKDNYRLPALLY